MNNSGQEIAKLAGQFTGLILGYLLFKNYIISKCIELNSEFAETPILNKVSEVLLISWSIVVPVMFAVCGAIMIVGLGDIAISKLLRH